MKTTLLFLLVAATSLMADPTLTTKKSYRAPISIVTDLGEIQIRTVVTDNITQPWSELKATEEGSPENGDDVTRSGTYEFSDGTKLANTANARVAGSEVIVKGVWKTTGDVKGFAYMALWVPQELTNDLVIEEGGSQVFPGFDKYLKLKSPGTFIFRQKSTGTFLFKVTGDYIGATIEFHEENPHWGLSLRLENVPDLMNSTLSESMEINWKVSFKE